MYKFIDISLHMFSYGRRRGTCQVAVGKEYKLVASLLECGLSRAVLVQGLGKGSCFFSA